MATASLSANAGGPVLEVRQPPPHTTPPPQELKSDKDGAAGATPHQGGCPIGNGVNTEASRGPQCKGGAAGLRLSLARPTPDLLRYLIK